MEEDRMLEERTSVDVLHREAMSVMALGQRANLVLQEQVNDRCAYMFPPLGLGGCKLVRGVIRGSATCDEFKARKGG